MSESTEGADKENEQPAKKQLDFVRWIMAFEMYALAAHACQVLVGRSSTLHPWPCLEYFCRSGDIHQPKLTCTTAYKSRHRRWPKVAGMDLRSSMTRYAGKNGTSEHIEACILYTSLSHNGSCEPVCITGDPDFDVNTASLQRDKDILDRARIAYDAIYKGTGSLAV